MRIYALLLILVLTSAPALTQTLPNPQWTLKHEFKTSAHHAFLSGDGSMLAIDKGETVEVYRTSDQLRIKSYKPLSNGSLKKAKLLEKKVFSVDGKVFVNSVQRISDTLVSITVWNTFSGTILNTYNAVYKCDTIPVLTKVTVNSENKLVGVCFNDTRFQISDNAFVWQVNNKEPVYSNDFHNPIADISFDDDNGLRYSYSLGNTSNDGVKWIEVFTGIIFKDLIDTLTTKLTVCHTHIAYQVFPLATLNKKGTIKLWQCDYRDYKDLLKNRKSKFIRAIDTQRENCESIVYSPDSRFITAIFADYSVRVYDCEDGSLFQEFRFNSAIKTCSFSKNSDRLAITDGEGVHLYELGASAASVPNFPVSIQSNGVPTGNRQALVIGNSTYRHGSSLDNRPLNDAQDVAARLEQLGFRVTTVTDATKSQIEQAIGKFSRVAQNADVALFFYAGHGIETEGINYLIPTDAQLEEPEEARLQTIPLDLILNEMKRYKTKVNLVYLDACRNKLFRSWNRNGVGRGLKTVGQLAQSTKVYYATQPGEVAQNGTGRNGVFTTSLLKHLQQGVEIEDLMREVTIDVINTTRKSQQPWSAGTLLTKFTF